jgi:uncharacterized protein HemX
LSSADTPSESPPARRQGVAADDPALRARQARALTIVAVAVALGAGAGAALNQFRPQSHLALTIVVIACLA